MLSIPDPLGYREELIKEIKRKKLLPVIETNQPIIIKYEIANDDDEKKRSKIQQLVENNEDLLACITPNREIDEEIFKRDYKSLLEEITLKISDLPNPKLSLTGDWFKFETGWKGKLNRLYLASFRANKMYDIEVPCAVVPVSEKWGNLRKELKSEKVAKLGTEPEKNIEKMSEEEAELLSRDIEGYDAEITDKKVKVTESEATACIKRRGTEFCKSKLTPDEFGKAIIELLTKYPSFGYMDYGEKCLCTDLNHNCEIAGHGKKQSLWGALFQLKKINPKITRHPDLFVVNDIARNPNLLSPSIGSRLHIQRGLKDGKVVKALKICLIK